MRLPVLSFLLVLVLAAPAAADSIVYTKDGNAWAARPDGSGAVRLTADGTAALPYEQTTQADDGTVLAVRGSRLHRFDRAGRRLATFGSVLTDKPGPINAYGPWDARISPDGTKVAYWLGIVGGWHDYATNTYYSDPQSAVVYQSATDGAQLGATMFYEQPTWTADSKGLLLWEPTNGGVPQVAVGAVGADHNHVSGWFHDRDVFADPGGWKPMSAGEMSRDGRRLAALRAPLTVGEFGNPRAGRNSVVFFDVASLTAPPTPLSCAWSDDHGNEISPPSFSPDGRQVAWATVEGIWVMTIGDPASCDGWTARLVIPGARWPDWGPADPGVAPAAPQAPAQPRPTQPAEQPRGRATVSIGGRIARQALVRRGMVVKARCSASCRVHVVMKAGRRALGTATARRSGAGDAIARVTLGRAAKRAVARRRVTRVTVTVTVRSAGRTDQVTRAVRVR